MYKTMILLYLAYKMTLNVYLLRPSPVPAVVVLRSLIGAQILLCEISPLVTVTVTDLSKPRYPQLVRALCVIVPFDVCLNGRHNQVVAHAYAHANFICPARNRCLMSSRLHAHPRRPKGDPVTGLLPVTFSSLSLQ